MTHPIHDLDDLVHQRSRLGILVVLSEGGRVQFSFLQDSLGLSEGNLSRHLTTLEGAGYVTIEKGYEGRRPRTWTRLTSEGQQALNQEVAALKAIVARAEAHPRSAAPTRKLSPGTAVT
jgi:DNA-binding MarR family transcriptional regulator